MTSTVDPESIDVYSLRLPPLLGLPGLPGLDITAIGPQMRDIMSKAISDQHTNRMNLLREAGIKLGCCICGEYRLIGGSGQQYRWVCGEPKDKYVNMACEKCFEQHYKTVSDQGRTSHEKIKDFTPRKIEHPPLFSDEQEIVDLIAKSKATSSAPMADTTSSSVSDGSGSPIPQLAVESKVQDCVVCLSKPADTIVSPCRHRVVCRECSDKLKSDPTNSKISAISNC